MERRSFLKNGLVASAAWASGCVSSINGASNPLYWTNARGAFPARRGRINLLNSGGGATPRAALSELARYQGSIAGGGAYTDPLLASLKESGSSASLRTRMAQTFGCRADEVALTRNAMEGLAIGLLGVDLQPGDEVLTTDADYDSCLEILRQRSARDDIRVKVIDIPMPSADDSEIVHAFEESCTDRTKLMLLCHMYNKNGQILPVRDICGMARAKGILTLVDGAQSLGHIDFRISDLGCDMFSASLHKWFYAPQGTGVFFVRRSRISSVWPIWASWSGKPATSIEKFEDYGTVSKAVSASLPLVFDFNDRIGAKRKEEQLREIRDMWIQPLLETGRVSLLTDLSPSKSCAITAFTVEGVDPDELARRMLSEHNIYIGSIHLRDKPSFVGNYLAADLTNSSADIERFLSGFSAIVA